MQLHWHSRLTWSKPPLLQTGLRTTHIDSPLLVCHHCTSALAEGMQLPKVLKMLFFWKHLWSLTVVLIGVLAITVGSISASAVTIGSFTPAATSGHTMYGTEPLLPFDVKLVAVTQHLPQWSAGCQSCYSQLLEGSSNMKPCLHVLQRLDCVDPRAPNQFLVLNSYYGPCWYAGGKLHRR